MSNKEKVFKKCDELFGEFEWTVDIHRSLDDGEIIYYINNDKNIEVAVGSSFKSLLSNINGQEYSEEIANKFFVDQFLKNHYLFIDHKETDENIHDIAIKEIRKHLMKGDWDALDYLVLVLQKEVVCLALDKKRSSVPNYNFFYSTISNKEWHEKMEDIEKKKEEELKKIKKSGLPF